MQEALELIFHSLQLENREVEQYTCGIFQTIAHALHVYTNHVVQEVLLF